MPVPELIFLAPPSRDDDHDGSAGDSAAASVRPNSEAGPAARTGARTRRPAGALRMTRGAREAATGMKVADEEIQRCLDVPEDVSPDPNTPSRTRFRHGNLVVVAGADGTVLRVNRRRS